jgi:hypothetical protein
MIYANYKTKILKYWQKYNNQKYDKIIITILLNKME